MTAADVPPGEKEERPVRPKHTSDAAHLDEDPEALEDPVHCGDAQHQHELHTHKPGNAG